MLKKILLTTTAIFGSLVVILCIHIYLVTRPRPADEHTIVMARVDLKQPITAANGDSITAWLYTQHGVDHVLCNTTSDIVVFTYYPVKINADNVVAEMKTKFGLDHAVRFIPSAADMKNGCPVASTSLTYKAYSFMKHIF